MKRRSFLKILVGITSSIIAPAISAKVVFTESKSKITVTEAENDQSNPDNLLWKRKTVQDDRVNPAHIGFDPAKPGEDLTITFKADKEGYLLSNTTPIPSRPLIMV